MGKEIKILMLEDVPADAELELRELGRAGITCIARRVETESDFRRELGEFMPDVILSDFTLPTFDGMSALAVAQALIPDTPFLFVSGTIGEERAIDALKRGATDYVLKANLARLGAAVQRAIHEAAERVARKRAEAELHLTKERLSLALNASSIAVWDTDIKSGEVWLTEQWAEMLGQEPTEIATTVDELLQVAHPEDRQRLLQLSIDVIKGRIPEYWAEHRVLTKSGEWKWIESRGKVVERDGNGYAVRMTGTNADINERKNQQDKISRLNRVYAVLSGINSAITRIHDRQELFREACRIAVEQGRLTMAWIGLAEPGTMKVKPVAWTGIEQGYLDEVGLSLRNVAEDHGMAEQALRYRKPVFANDIETDPRVVYKKAALARGYRSLVVLPLLVADNAAGVLALYASEPDVFDDEELKLLQELAGDISFALEVIAKEEKLNYLAYYDVLTGLPNRTLFDDRLKQHVVAAQHDNTMLAVIQFDLERFGLINDTLGRQAGDALLKLVAERLKSSLSDPNSLARVSANGFTVTLANVEDAGDVAHSLEGTIIASLNRPFQMHEEEFRISAKFGIALFPGDGQDADTLLTNAEAALRGAKESGDKYLFYAPQMNVAVAEKLTLENKLRKAVEAEQFVLYYQPKVVLATGRISGLEALIRWNDPDTGLVPPGKFIPVLEETGLILDVGTWALEQAASDYRQMAMAGLAPPRIAVNVSPIQLRQKDFVAVVEKTLNQARDGFHGLDLEITEGLIMASIEDNIGKLRAIRELGVGIAIDDFGTGYSSLSYLARLPVDALKIDRAFIMNLATSADDMTIVSTIISLAHSLKLNVIAEGVETAEQQNLLRLLKCDEIQGYVFSKPVPQEQIEQILTHNRSPG